MRHIEKLLICTEFSAIIAQMQIKLAIFKNQHPGADTTEREELIKKLSDICSVYDQMYRGATNYYRQYIQAMIEKQAILDELLKLKATLDHADTL